MTETTSKLLVTVEKVETESRPKPKRKHAYKRATGLLKRYREEYARIYREARDYGKTHDWVIQKRKERIFDHEDYARLPRWAVERISEYADVCYWDWSGEWIYTHVQDGQRIHSDCRSVVFDHQAIAQRNHDRDVDRSCHCQGYVLDGRVVWVPVDGDDLESELTTGRLTGDMLGEIRKYRRYPLPRIKVWDGRTLIETEFLINVQDGMKVGLASATLFGETTGG